MTSIAELATLANDEIASDDYLAVYDVSAGTDKKITRADLFYSPMPFNGFILASGSETLADNAESDLDSIAVGVPATANGLLFVVDISAGVTAQFYLRSGVGAAVEMSDPSGSFSVTAGTTSSTNIYYSGGGKYAMQNKSGDSRVYLVIYMGTA